MSKPVEHVVKPDQAVNIKRLFKMIDEDKNGTVEIEHRET